MATNFSLRCSALVRSVCLILVMLSRLPVSTSCAEPPPQTALPHASDETELAAASNAARDRAMPARLPRNGLTLLWDEDCQVKPRKTMKVPSHFIPLAAETKPALEPWNTELEKVQASPDLATHAADIDGDGMTDILAGISGTKAMYFGISTGRGFKIHPITVNRTVSDSFPVGVVLDGSPGKCARIAIPPDKLNEPYSFYGWKELKGLPADATNLPLRAYPSSVFFAWNDRRTDLMVGERIRGTQTSTLWGYNSGIGWFGYFVGSVGLSGDYLGMGYPLGGEPVTGIYREITERNIQVVRAVTPSGPQILSSLPIPVEEQSRILHGDFNGDSLTDFLYLRDNSRDGVAWLSVSFVDTPVIVPLSGVNEAIGNREVLTAGDFDGDGADEILLSDSVNGFAILRLLGDPLPPRVVTVTVDGVAVPVDSRGRFKIELEVNRTSKVRFESDLYELAPSAIDITADRPGWDRLGIQILAKSKRRRGAPYTGFFSDKGPYTCTGWIPGRSVIDEWPHSAYARQISCPEDFAAVEVDDGIAGLSCCEVPAGMLKPKSAKWLKETRCPAGSIAVGMEREGKHFSEVCPDGGCDQVLKCAEIDGTRYRLLEDTPGTYWGDGARRAFGVHQRSRNDIPNGLRHGVGRIAWNRWDMDGCAPPSWGALFRGGYSKKGKECENYYFARIEPLQEGADSASPDNEWKKNPTFPIRSCSTPPDPFNPYAGCNGID